MTERINRVIRPSSSIAAQHTVSPTPVGSASRLTRATCGERWCFSYPIGTTPMLVDSEHAALDGGGEQLSRVRDPHLLHHIGAVCVDRLDADVQSLADVCVLQAGPNQFEKFLLARRQRLRRFWARRRCAVSKRLPKPRLATRVGHHDQWSFTKHALGESLLR